MWVETGDISANTRKKTTVYFCRWGNRKLQRNRVIPSFVLDTPATTFQLAFWNCANDKRYFKRKRLCSDNSELFSVFFVILVRVLGSFLVFLYFHLGFFMELWCNIESDHRCLLAMTTSAIFWQIMVHSNSFLSKTQACLAILGGGGWKHVLWLSLLLCGGPLHFDECFCACRRFRCLRTLYCAPCWDPQF